MTNGNYCSPDGVCYTNGSGQPEKDTDSRQDAGTEGRQGKEPGRKKNANRLIHEKSPYLLQHAYNPVDWYPWGKEAFEKAERENKPVFLSIGYSSCHWCHVMEEESFDNEDVAKVLNDHFVSVKVDKEERPDIDMVYMAACQMFTGSGGWPTTIIMAPDQKPFYAGTYFPRENRYGQTGLLEILSAIEQMWREEPEKLLDTADKIQELLIQRESGKPEGGRVEKKRVQNTSPDRWIVDAKRMFEQTFDEVWGGFGKPPKFPIPHNLLFLMKFHEEYENDRALYMTEKTLQQMYRGGLFDHIGYGFSRYSTDEKWLVPHFEKMLYDNALLIIAYLECYRITQKELYREVASKTLQYVLDEMMSSEGGFYSAQDADSGGEEGKFYVFEREEILKVLGAEEGADFCTHYGIHTGGNFEGKNIPNLIDNDEFEGSAKNLEMQRQAVYRYRAGREQLHRDEKILTSWNALMVVALARASAILGEKRYEMIAEKTVSFIQDKLTKPGGKLHVRYCDGDAAGDGYLDDYAFYMWALIELSQATHKVKYLQTALDCQNLMIEQFWDKENGGFYFYGKDHEPLLFRPKEAYDGAVPSGNAVAALAMQQLQEKIPGSDKKGILPELLEYLKEACSAYPSGFTFGLLAQMKAIKSGATVQAKYWDDSAAVAGVQDENPLSF